MAANEDLELEVDEGAEPELDISPEAKSAWDKALEKRGLAPKEDGGEPETEGGPAPSRAPRQRPARQPDTTMLPPARGHRERLEARKTTSHLQSEIAELKELVRTLLPKDPELDPDADPTGYTKDLIRKAALEGIGGEEVVSFLRELREERLAARERFEMAQREKDFYDEWANEMVDYEQIYERDHPEMAKGYRQRLGQFFQASVKMHTSLGLPKPQAETEAIRGLIALTDKALANNVLPPAYLDHLFRQTLQANGGNGNGHDGGRDRQRAENRETRERTKAAGATSALSTAKAPPAPTTGGKMAAAAEDAPSGRGRASALKDAAKRAGGDPKRNLREMGR